MKRLKLPPLPRLLHTTAVRLALRYALVYAGVLGLLLLAFLWSTQRVTDPELASELQRELANLKQAEAEGGGPAVAAAVAQLQADHDPDEPWPLLVAASGDKLAGTLLRWPSDPIVVDDQVHRAWIEDKAIPPEVYDDDAYCSVIAHRFADGSRVLLAQHDPEAEELRQITEHLTEALAAVVVLLLLMGVGLGRTLLRRMDELGRDAERIAAGDLSQRLPVSTRGDEFDALSLRLNAMLERIEQLVRGLREVTDNVAHDLRSPLTRLRNRFEVTLLEPRADTEYRQSLLRGIEDADGLIKTFNALLGIAQAEAGSRRAQWTKVDLAALARDVAELYEPLAEEKGQVLQVDAKEPAPIDGSRDLLAQALGNLLDNAVKYTPAGGTIRVQITAAAGHVELNVTDSGPGIPQAERQRVLERFVRLESSRHTPGNGLGLSLVQAVCKLHGAELLLDDAHPGLRVLIRLA